ncbi:MAG: GNAT family N-acetyltransferase [Anaerolineales bacterium]|nr:GNAT family N-acetyltransferase [Chloroflexota bacterium]MBL6980373.1 GNAT family N-acetyltransferase [Anaerolineales bacterium]
MSNYQISFMENNDTKEAAKVLSIAMLNNPFHVAIFQGNSEVERLEIELMFMDLFTKLPGIVFLAKENKKIIGVMRMKSCVGSKKSVNSIEVKEKNSLDYRKYTWKKEWAIHDPVTQHWHLGPIGVLPGYRGMGVGSKLMQIFCKEVDACSAQAYLETDLDENVHLYQKFGFEVIATSNIIQVENRYMLRVSKT